MWEGECEGRCEGGRECEGRCEGGRSVREDVRVGGM